MNELEIVARANASQVAPIDRRERVPDAVAGRDVVASLGHETRHHAPADEPRDVEAGGAPLDTALVSLYLGGLFAAAMVVTLLASLIPKLVIGFTRIPNKRLKEKFSASGANALTTPPRTAVKRSCRSYSSSIRYLDSAFGK